MKLTSYNIKALKIFVCNTENWSTLDESRNATVWCTESDLKMLDSIHNPKRRREILAVRYLLWQLGLKNELYYEGRIPKLKNGQHISISHSKNLVVLAFSEEHPIGVDVEFMQSRARNVYEKFVHEKESVEFPRNCELKTTLLWSFKESVFKLIQEEGILFKEQIVIHRLENGDYVAQIFTRRGNFEVPLGHRLINDYVLTFNTGDVQRQG